MIVLVVVIIVIILVGMIIVIILALAVLDRADRRQGLESRHAVALGRLDHIEDALLEAAAVDDQRIGVVQLGHLLGRRLEVVGIDAHRHQRDDLDVVAGDRLDDVAEDVGGDDDRRHLARCSRVSVASVRAGVAPPACAEHQARRRERDPDSSMQLHSHGSS